MNYSLSLSLMTHGFILWVSMSLFCDRLELGRRRTLTNGQLIEWRFVVTSPSCPYFSLPKQVMVGWQRSLTILASLRQSAVYTHICFVYVCAGVASISWFLGVLRWQSGNIRCIKMCGRCKFLHHLVLFWDAYFISEWVVRCYISLLSKCIFLLVCC